MHSQKNIKLWHNLIWAANNVRNKTKTYKKRIKTRQAET
jgi:hypothetical protein